MCYYHFHHEIGSSKRRSYMCILTHSYMWYILRHPHSPQFTISAIHYRISCTLKSKQLWHLVQVCLPKARVLKRVASAHPLSHSNWVLFSFFFSFLAVWPKPLSLLGLEMHRINENSIIRKSIYWREEAGPLDRECLPLSHEGHMVYKEILGLKGLWK